MGIRDRRTAHGWTQEQLALNAGLSVRTIQRLENGQVATLETLKCLAAVFETNVSTLMQEQDMTMTSAPIPDSTQEKREKDALAYVENLKGLYVHAILFVVIIPCLAVLNLVISPQAWWIVYVILGWLFGLGLHAVLMFSTFGLFGAGWEQRQFRKRLQSGEDAWGGNGAAE